MKIVFPVFVKNAHSNPHEGVWGEELIANRFQDILNRNGYECDVVQVLDLEGKHYDIAIYSSYNLIHPAFLKEHADKNILWLQGFNYDANRNIMSLDDLYIACKPYYDLIITSSRTLARKYNIPFVIPAIDLLRYHLCLHPNDYLFDVSFIGNIIKPWETNQQYLSPMSDFNYRIFGGDMGKIDHDEWLDIVWSSKVNLHYGFKEGIEWDMVTGSPLFLAASGGFCMSDKIPWFMETFKDAMAFTDGGDEEAEQIIYYLKNDDAREKMAIKAYEIIRHLDMCSDILRIVKGV